MTSSDFASVVVPVYDRGAVLETVLEYFSRQTYPLDLFEVIVVDDGSPDGIGQTLKARTFPLRLEVVVQENRGRAAARNAGVRRAAGDVILFCDADRIPDPDWVRSHVEFHSRERGVAAIGTPYDSFCRFDRVAEACDAAVALLRRFARQPEYYRAVSSLFSGGTSTSSIAWAAFLVGNSSLRREDFWDAGGFDEALSLWGIEHFDLGLRLAERCGVSMRLLPAAASYHIPHSHGEAAYRRGIEEGIRILSRKRSDLDVGALRDFLLGQVSLQDFEARWSGAVCSEIRERAPIRFGRFDAA